ncbi:hypothetical protein BC829DRAFT_366105, partial [Chytridium lagenaria]
LLHVADCIRMIGPMWAYWQYPTERVCGLLLPLIKSKVFAYENVSRACLTWMQLNSLLFVRG